MKNCVICLQELTQKEVEYISLSRDTTEADLKQRREILNGTAHYVDQVHSIYMYIYQDSR